MTRRRRGLHLAIGCTAAVLYSNFLLDLMIPGPHEWAKQVSALEIPGHRSAALLRTTDVVSALLVLSQLPAVRRALPRSRWRTVVLGGVAAFAAGGILAAIITLPAPGTEELHRTRHLVHDLSSIVSVGGMVASAAAARILLRGPRERRPRWLTAAVVVVAIGCAAELGSEVLVALWPGLDLVDGLAQRAQMLTLSAWIVGLAGLAGWAGPTGSGPDAAAGGRIAP